MHELIQQRFPFFKEPELVDAIANVAKEVNVKEGEPIIKVGEFIKSTPLITKGLLKIVRQDNEGHEILLYYLDGGNNLLYETGTIEDQSHCRNRHTSALDPIPLHG